MRRKKTQKKQTYYDNGQMDKAKFMCPHPPIAEGIKNFIKYE